MGQAAALAPGSVGANVVAIDNKIEQAMVSLDVLARSDQYRCGDPGAFGWD